jgi:mannose-1-phosphate guanylyltransferase/mannose-1-phosphate guanylyltransferase/mannose-6-phosphate isomerase
MSSETVTPVILSGGAGSRLWPLSVPDRPKQLIALAESQTMLQATALRVPGNPIIVAGEGHVRLVERQLSEIGIAPGALVLEPFGRNTAPAIALAALLAPAERPMIVMPSDHLIRDLPRFSSAIEAAIPISEDGWLVTFGIAPDRIETGYGYIELGAPIAHGVSRVARFREKPDRTTAAAYFAGGRHLWNSGIFLFRPETLLEALERLAPDYALMEQADNIAVVPVSMGWSDLGSWDAVYEEAPKDCSGNVISGNVVALRSSGCLIRSDGPPVAAMDLEDLLIVATATGIVVSRRGGSQGVKEALELLNKT